MVKILELFGNTIYISDEQIEEQKKEQAKTKAREKRLAEKKIGSKPKSIFKAANPAFGWQKLFVAKDRMDFLQKFIAWRNKGGEELPDDGKNFVCLPGEQLLFYYDFQECHQYSLTMMQRLCNTPVETIEKDIQRYIRLLANDTRVLGKLLKQSVPREFNKRRQMSERELAKLQRTEPKKTK